MIIKITDPNVPKPSEITPEKEYLTRRRFFGRAGLVVAAATLAACAPQLTTPVAVTEVSPATTLTDELGNKSYFLERYCELQ